MDAYADVSSKEQAVTRTKTVAHGGASEIEIHAAAVDIEVAEQKEGAISDSVAVRLECRSLRPSL